MGKVNVAKLRYMSRGDFRVLTAVRSTPSSPVHPGGVFFLPLQRLLAAERLGSGLWVVAEPGTWVKGTEV